uniref:Uncharacterized protein n=1 Tax=Solanum tuberosum TaxID=4113 RepID=M1DIN8_SOLTU
MRTAGMSREPPVELSQPPDQCQSERHDNDNKPQLLTPHYTFHSSFKLQDTYVVNTSFSEKELEGIRKIISYETIGSNHGKMLGLTEYTSSDLQHSKKTIDSTIPIDRNREAISTRIANESPESLHQIQATSGQIRTDSTTRDYSSHDGVHLTEISIQMDGGIIGGENFGVNRFKVTGVHEKSGNMNVSPPVDIHLSEISSNLDRGNIIDNQVNRSTDHPKNVNEGTSRNMHNIEGSGSLPDSSAGINIQLDANSQLGARNSQDGDNAMQEKNLNGQQANDQPTKIHNSENSSDEAHSSNFSFGIKETIMELAISASCFKISIHRNGWEFAGRSVQAVGSRQYGEGKGDPYCARRGVGWECTNISMASSSQNPSERIGEDDSSSQDIHNSQKSQDSTAPIVRTPPAASAKITGDFAGAPVTNYDQDQRVVTRREITLQHYSQQQPNTINYSKEGNLGSKPSSSQTFSHVQVVVKVQIQAKDGLQQSHVAETNSLVEQKKNGESIKADYHGKLQDNVTSKPPNCKSNLNVDAPINIAPVKTAQLHANLSRCWVEVS